MLGSFEFRGAKIAYSTKGKGRTILLIHGFLGAKEIWKDFESRLARNFKVISIDLPGHGKSHCIGYVHNMELLADCCKHLLTHLSVRKAIVVGHTLQWNVTKLYNGKVFAIDVKHPKDYSKHWPFKKSEGLLITDGNYYQLFANGDKKQI